MEVDEETLRAEAGLSILGLSERMLAHMRAETGRSDFGFPGLLRLES